VSEEIGAGRRALLHAFVDEVKANPRVEPRVFLATTYVDELLRGNASLRRQLAQAEERARKARSTLLVLAEKVCPVGPPNAYEPGNEVAVAQAVLTEVVRLRERVGELETDLETMMRTAAR